MRFALACLFLLTVNVSADIAWRAKVHPDLLVQADAPDVSYLVFLADQWEAPHGKTFASKEERGRFVFESLRDHAADTQAPLRAVLDDVGVQYQSFWVANMILVEGGGAALMEEVAARNEVRGLYRNERAHFGGAFQIEEARHEESDKGTAVEWNINAVGAPTVWADGNYGQAGTIGMIDTGYDWDHPALVETYRGTQFGIPIDHNYNWHDAITGPGTGGVCGPDSPFPCDDHGHGTHTAGTMVGDDFGANQIGVAPGAEWIGCRCMDQGNGTPGTYSDCLQWMIAPTDLAGNNPDPSKAPDVLNNSWSCPASEGCTDINVLKTVVENVRAAGIVVVVSAGNEGPNCETVARPIAIYDGSFSIGATDINQDIAGFSSRGAVSVDSSGRAKPDMSAPGVNVRSSIPGGSYTSLNGTSMAAPHVAGAVALLVTANPGLRGDVDAIEAILTGSATPRTSVDTCSGLPGSSIPNHTFGHGILDVYAAHLDAINQAVGVAGGASVPSVSQTRNEPNPFNPVTAIHFALPEAGAVTMTVYDVRGRAIRTLIESEALAAGPQSVRWDGMLNATTEAPSGVYFYRIESGAFRATGRMNLVR